jgi:PleD family two-component response regulator
LRQSRELLERAADLARLRNLTDVDEGFLEPDAGGDALIGNCATAAAEAVRRLLAGLADIDLHYCADWNEAIKQANKIKPRVILQDSVMPSIDGLDLVQLYRANPGTAETPIIVLSSEEDRSQAQRRAS